MKRVLISIIVLLGLAGLAAALLLWWLLDAERLREHLQTQLSQNLGREVSIAGLEPSLLQGGIAIRGLVISEDPAFGEQPFLRAGTVSGRLRWMPLLRERRADIVELRIDQPQLRLIQSASGGWNIDSLVSSKPDGEPGSGDALQVGIQRLLIDDGQVTWVDRTGKAQQLSDLQLDIRDFALDAAFPVSLSVSLNGQAGLQVSGQVGPLQADDIISSPMQLEWRLKDLDLVGMGWLEEGAGSGVVDHAGTLRMSQAQAQLQGEFGLRALQLVAAGAPLDEPVQFRYRARHNLRTARGELETGQLVSGEALMALTGNYELGSEVPHLELAMQVADAPLLSLQTLSPAFGIELPENSRFTSGTLNTQLTVSGALDALLISGPLMIDDARLLGFALGQHLGSVLSLAGVRTPADTLIEAASTRLEIKQGEVRLHDIDTRIAELGVLAGQGHIDGDGALNFALAVRLHEAVAGEQRGESRAARALGSVLGTATQRDFGFRVTGTAAEPRFAPDSASLGRLAASALVGALSRPSSTDEEPDASDELEADAEQPVEAERQRSDPLRSLERALRERRQREDDP